MASRLRRLGASVLVGLSAVSIAPAASATPESDAKDLFARARELRANNDCSRAAPLFRKAWIVYPQGLGSLRNLAECEEQLGHFASARRAWLDLKRALAASASVDAKYEGWDKDAEEAATRLKPKVGSFVVDVIVKSPEGEGPANDQSGVELFVNGESIGTALVGAPLERDPGSYRIRAQTADAKPIEQTVAIAAGENPKVTLRLTREPKAKVDLTAASATSGGSRATIGWVVAGVGAAALVGSGITFLLRQSALSDLKDGCKSYETGPCDPSLKGTVDRGKAMSTLSPILLGAGVVGVGAGVALILTAPRTGAEPGASATAERLTIRAGLGRVDATWRF